jgi:hypothetical protein
MDKYLFTDGTNGIKEAHTKEELLSLINSSPDPANTRIWKFNSNEWTRYADLLKKDPSFKQGHDRKINPQPVSSITRQKEPNPWWKKTAIAAFILGWALLVFNFTSAKWEPAEPLQTSAIRPTNVPVMDIDSLVEEIEWMRGKLVDKGTRQNLRLRNNWPEYILLKLEAEQEKKGAASRYINAHLKLENATGLELDKVLVEVQVWKKGKASIADTLHFEKVKYDQTTKRALPGIYQGDSLSLSFRTIRAKAFNFCYSSSVKNNSGNYNDRWFCRDGKPNE